MTAWRSKAPISEPVQIFVHALNQQSEIIGQWDGIRSDIRSWSTGDVFVQFHSFAISEEVEINQMVVGLYNPISETRLGEQITIFKKE